VRDNAYLIMLGFFGTPVYMNLKATERAPILDAKEAEKKDKSLKGIVYNVSL